jgi:tRNA(fMet)-specific endonuclease VapC
MLLDSSVIIDFFRGRAEATTLINANPGFFVPVFVLGELYTGALRSRQSDKHLIQIRSFITFVTVVSAGMATAALYGKIKSSLWEKGKPIPENDIWIAAMAVEHGYTSVTRDRHFSSIEGLLIKFIDTE